MEKFTRYREILSSLAGPRLRRSAAQPAATDSIALGAAAAALMLDDDPALHDNLADGFRHLAHRRDDLADAQGRRRPAYRPFVLHLHLAAFASRYETLGVGQWSVCEQSISAALEPAREAENYSAQPPPADRVDATLWQAVAIWEQAIVLKRDVDLEWVDGVVHQILRRPGPDGSLHPRSSGESDEAWWWSDRCGLHALANLALLGRNPAWSGRVEQIAMYHQAHAPPAGIVAQPWALFAYAWSSRTRALAEQQIHSVEADAGAGLDVLTTLLLADAACSLARFEA
jgi:hypothetical protein